MKAYVVVNKKGKIIRAAGIEFRRKSQALITTDSQGRPSGEKIKSFTIPLEELK